MFAKNKITIINQLTNDMSEKKILLIDNYEIK